MEEEEDEKAEDGGIPAWIVGFADLMTLLFATFVVLYGLKPEGKTQAFVGAVSSIRESFIDIPDDIPVEIKRGKIILGKSTFKKDKGTSVAPKIIIMKEDTDYPIKIVNKSISSVISKVNLLSQQAQPVTQDQKTLQAITYTISENQLNVKFLTSAFFERDSAELNQANMQNISTVLATLADLNRPIHFEGHTALASNSRKVSNWELSARRASNLALFFVQEFGYPKEKVTSAGLGSEKPQYGKRETFDVDFRNDRVEVKVNFK